MSAYNTDFKQHERLRAAIISFLSQSGPKHWPSLAAELLPDPPSAVPIDELKLYRAWINYSYAAANGHLQRYLGRSHPELAAAQKAVADRAIMVTSPIRDAIRAAENPAMAVPPAVAIAAQAARAASVAGAKPADDAARRYPLSGAKPFHRGSVPHSASIQQINIPAGQIIPFGWRERATRLICKLFATTRQGRKQGLGKQSGQTVLKSLMLNFCNNATNRCDPAYKTIAARCGLGRSTVAEAIAVLTDLGFLVVTNRTKQAPILSRAGVIGYRQVQTSNSYALGFGNPLAIAAAAGHEAIDAVAAWLEEWYRSLRELKNYLLKQSESRIHAGTNDDNYHKENIRPKPTSRTSFLRRVCRWRTVFDPRTGFNPSASS